MAPTKKQRSAKLGGRSENGGAMTVQEITTIEEKCTDSLHHVNGILKLLKQAKQLPRVHMSANNKTHPLPVHCVHALRRILLSYFDQGRILSRKSMEKLAKQPSADKQSTEARVTLNTWLLEQCEKYFQLLLETLTTHENEQIVALSLRTVMEFSGKSPAGSDSATAKPAKEESSGKPRFELNFDLICRVLVALCVRFEHYDCTSLLTIFREEYVEEFDDVRLAVSQGVRRAADAKMKSETPANQNLTGYWQPLASLTAHQVSEALTEIQMLVSLPPDDESWGTRSYMVPPHISNGNDGNGEEDQGSSDNDDDSDYESAHFLQGEINGSKRSEPSQKKKSKKKRSTESEWDAATKAGILHQQRKALENAWLAIMSLPLSPVVYRRILLSIASDIAPNMANPLLLSDFLMEAYEVGSATSLLALSGLWYLIQNHGLEHSQFYPKLYQLLTPENIRAKYRVRFYKMLDLFLSSTTLPAYLVASFAKRLARLALIGPPSFSTFAVPFLYNLLKRHPACSHMVHKAQLDPRQQNLSKKTNKVQDKSQSDVFDPNTDDPSQTKALESELWELVALRKHYCPSIAGVSACFERGFQGGMFDVTKNSRATYESLFHQMLEPKPSRGATSNSKKNWSKKRAEKEAAKDQRTTLLSQTALAILTNSDLEAMSDGYLTVGHGFQADYSTTGNLTLSGGRQGDKSSESIAHKTGVSDITEMSTKRLNLFPLLFSSPDSDASRKRKRTFVDDVENQTKAKSSRS